MSGPEGDAAPGYAWEAMSMRHSSTMRGGSQLYFAERLISGLVGVGLLGAALVFIIAPPQHRVALSQCPDVAAGCIVSVDSDLTSFAAVLAAGAAVAIILAVLGVRFNQVKLPGAELGYQEFEKEIAGLPQAVPAADGRVDVDVTAIAEKNRSDAPIEVEVREGLGKPLHAVPVAVTRLTIPMRKVDPSFLRDYSSARRESQQSYFLTHILGPATRAGQKYSVAIRVTPHEDASQPVKSATFYLGRSWGNKAFEGRRGPDGRFGIATEAYGSFLALCEVEFEDGSRILLDHYCDFDMGSLLPS